ncbi:MAG: endonuclease III [Opitutales bacterium]|nr:endonuclease III [Opitutales bacterium]
MTRKERAAIVQRELDLLYPAPPIPLVHSDAFSLLVSVVLSAQCTDVRVNQVTPELFALADNPADMARQDVERIRAIVRPCGLSERKASAIKELSRMITDNYAGKVPDTLEQLEELPGVGHKTASVLMVQAFGQPAFPVDTHIHRLAARWKLSDGKNVEKTERDLKKLFPKESWGKLHLQIIHYGREYCMARACDGHKCHICKLLNGDK